MTLAHPRNAVEAASYGTRAASGPIWGKIMRLLARFAAIAILALALAGCTIVSRTPLLSDGELVTPLPDRLQLAAYDVDTLQLSPDDNDDLLRDGDVYLSAKGYRLRFASPPDTEGRYLVEVSGSKESDEGYMYGLARFADNLLGIEIVLPDDIDTVLAAHPELGLAAGNDALEITTREQLDQVIALVRSGEMKLQGFVYSASETADAVAPAELVRDGDWYRARSAD